MLYGAGPTWDEPGRRRGWRLMAGLRVTEDELRELLVQRLGILDEAGFEKARTVSARLRIPLDRALVERGRIPQAFLLEQLARAWGVGFVDLKMTDIGPEALRTLPHEYARAHTLVPFNLQGKQLDVAMWDARDRRVIDEIERM